MCCRHSPHGVDGEPGRVRVGVDVRNAKVRSPAQTRCALDVTCDNADITLRPDETKNAPFRLLGLDIQCMTLDVNVFPTANKSVPSFR